MGLIQQEMIQLLQQGLSPEHLDVLNESHLHSVPPGSESHFKVVLVSSLFQGLRPAARHQRIYQQLPDFVGQKIHALAIHAYTPEEWQAAGAAAPASPLCRGGSKAGE